MVMSCTVHTRDGSPQSGLGDMWTCRTTPFVCHVVATSDGRKKAEEKVSVDWCVTVEH